MKLSFKNFELKLASEFRLSLGSRKTTPVVLIELSYEGYTGYGEAALPPYLEENQSSVISFLSKLNFDWVKNPVSEYEEIINYILSAHHNKNAANASVDIALHDLIGKLTNKPVHEFLGITTNKIQPTCYTIGISTEDELKEKIQEAAEFKSLKIKLDGINDIEIILQIRKYTDKPLFVDANQGWKDLQYGIDIVEYLSNQNVVLIEQPFNKYEMDLHRKLKEKSNIPIIADESFQSFENIKNISEAFDGINIKLMKCGGIYNAKRIIEEVKNTDLKIMFGCMTESSCGISAALQLAAYANWIDLDGNMLISNDPYSGIVTKNGIHSLNSKSGLGINRI